MRYNRAGGFAGAWSETRYDVEGTELAGPVGLECRVSIFFAALASSQPGRASDTLGGPRTHNL
jgi:hypothetical protein